MVVFDLYLIDFIEAGDGTRTRDLLITNQLLYQLSYASLNEALFYVTPTIMAMKFIDFPNNLRLLALSMSNRHHRGIVNRNKFATHIPLQIRILVQAETHCRCTRLQIEFHQIH